MGFYVLGFETHGLGRVFGVRILDQICVIIALGFMTSFYFRNITRTNVVITEIARA